MIAPPTQIAGQQLNPEQQRYLEGFFAGLQNRGYRFSDLEPAPSPTNPAPVPNPEDLSELTAEERLKRELHPLDAYPLLLQHAAANQAPDKENTFRFKWHGLFYLAPAHDGFMARLRIPGGQLQTFQLREIARIAQSLTTGYIQITTRANFQLRLIQPKNAPELLRRIQAVGLHTRGAGADNIRNLTCNPTAGFDPLELVDPLPYIHELGQLILNDRAFYNLPRKFNIAIDGGGLIGALEDTNDIGAKAVRLDQETNGVAPGVYFRIAVGGATGHKAFAKDLGIVVPPPQLVPTLAALTRTYLEHGNRTDRKRARLKHLLDSMAPEAFLAATEKTLGASFLRVPIEAAPLNHPSQNVAHSHIGIHPHKEPGRFYAGVALPAGQITARQLLRLADLADHYGSGEVRLTVWQNLILPGIPESYVATVQKALVKMGLDWRQSNLRSGLVACTGNTYCKYASANTKGHALELADYLERRLSLDQPLNIHLTGCPHSCAQHYIGDIGLLAATVKVNGEPREGYHVFVGGGFASHAAIGRQIYQGLSVEQLKPTLENILRAYLAHRLPNESFRAFTQRHDLRTLQELFENPGPP